MLEKSLWITAPDCAGKTNCAIRYWRRFEVAESGMPQVIHIAAVGNYLCWLNGHLIGRGPVRGTHHTVYVDTLDLTGAVQAGSNILAVMVHSQGRDNFCYATAESPCLRLEIPGVLVSDGTFHAERALDFTETDTLYTLPIGICEERDMCLASSDNWLSGEGEASRWMSAIPAEYPALEARMILPRPIPALRETQIELGVPLLTAELALTPRQEGQIPAHWLDALSRVNVKQLGASGASQELLLQPQAGYGAAVVWDLGQDRIGFPEFVIEGAVGGEELFLSFGEHLHEGNRVQSCYAPNMSMSFTDCYRLAPGRNKIGTQFMERGARYMQLAAINLHAPLKITRAVFTEHRYPVEKRGIFFSSDPLLNSIWNMSQETLSLCMTDIFTDCPWREHAFWSNDIVVENCTSLQLFGAIPMQKHAFTMLAAEQRPDGWIPGMCPAPKGDAISLVLPGANLSLFRALADYYLYSNDGDTVRAVLPAFQRMLEAAEATRDADGLVRAPAGSWNFYDWAHEFSDVCFREYRESLFNFLYITAIDLFLKLAHAVGYAVDENHLNACRNRVIEACWRVFPIRNGRLYDECGFYEPQFQPEGAVHPPVATQLSHALALESGTVPEKLHQAFVEALSDPEVLGPDLYMHFYVLRELHRAGLDQAALERIRRYWSPLVDSGDATLWEFGIVQQAKSAAWGAGSLCHGFSTSPVDFIQSVLLGVRPIKPGFAEFEVQIKPCDLTFAEGKVPTPHGDIVVCWTLKENSLIVKLTVPQETVALVNGQRLAPGKHQVILPA